jgi:damage-control phosphatase, subfamily I
MNPCVQCAACIFKWTAERCAIGSDAVESFSLVRTLADRLSREFHAEGNVGKISMNVLESVKNFVPRSSEYFFAIKTESNNAAECCLSSAAAFINNAKNDEQRFAKACCLSAAANVSPIGAPSKAFEFSEAAALYSGARSLPPINGDLGRVIETSKRVLFLADNAGEIGFDALLIQTLVSMGLRVTLIIKKKPFFDDATMEDALRFGIGGTVDEILEADGLFIPGERDDALEKAYRRSGMVVSKGVLNFETHYGEPSDKHKLYLLKAKCNPIARLTGLDVGMSIVRLHEADTTSSAESDSK